MVESEKDQTESAATVTEISSDLVGGLGGKLDEFARGLSDDEQMTLATAMALAARGIATACGPAACIGVLAIGLGRNGISAIRRAGSSIPRLSQSLESVFCPGKASRFGIEGLEVERSFTGAKSVTAGAKSVAAGFCGNAGLMGAKSVAAAGFAMQPGFAGAKSTAAGSFPGFAGAKSTAAGFCRNPGMLGAKSTAAAFCRNPGMLGAKSTAAAFCRNPAFAGAKSVAAGFCRTPGFAGAKSTAAGFCRNPWASGYAGYYR